MPGQQTIDTNQPSSLGYFRWFYTLTGWGLLLLQLGFLLVWTYSALEGRILFYEAKMNPALDAIRYYFTCIDMAFFSTIILLLIWILLTPIAILINRKLPSGKIRIVPGLIGFVLGIVLLMADNFHIVAWYIDEAHRQQYLSP